MKTRSIKSVRLTGVCLALAATPFVLAGCSSDAQSPASTDPGADAENVSESSEGLTLTDWKATVCKVIDHVPSFPAGKISVIDPECAVDGYDHLYYFGAKRANDATPSHAQAISDATYCAIAQTGERSASNRTARAAFRSIVGEFGAESEFRTFARNNATRDIESEHFGKVVVFGLPITLNYSNTSWDFTTESQTAKRAPAIRDATSSSPAQPYTQSLSAATGHYVRANTQNLTRWGIGASGSFKVGPIPVLIEMDIRNKESFKDYGNGRFAPSPPSWANYAARVDPYNQCMEACAAGGGAFCSVGCGVGPTSSQILGHELQCSGGCNKAYYRDLADGFLPHSGQTSGARANIIFDDPVDNWWQFGYPGSTALSQLGEKKYSLRQAPSGTSTHYRLGIAAGYNAGIAKIKVGTDLDFYGRAGAALRSTSVVRDSGLAPLASVRMQLDAEAAIDLNVGLEVSVDLPIVGTKKILEATHDLIDSEDPVNGRVRVKDGASVSWGVGSSPDTTACLANTVAETTTAQPPTTNIWDVTEELGSRMIDNIHPCHAEICEPSSAGSNRGRFKTYDWDPATGGLVPVVTAKTNTACEVCETSVAVCNAAGDILPVSQKAQPIECGGTGSICGGREPCNDLDACSNSNATCDASGCCVVVK